MGYNENITNMDWQSPELTGDARRFQMLDKTFEGSAVFPKSLEYKDIDKEVMNFFENNINMVNDNGKKVPIYSLFSNQRFTEFTQTWNHTDSEGNLLMNFMTINRANNPTFGDNQGKSYNIPNNRRYTIAIKECLEDNGNESYEVYSMEQPFSVNMMYRINFVTSKFSKVNEINMIMNNLFKSLQCYICPNGYYLPMILDNINDDTQYNLEDRKFYIQSFDIKVLAYIIRKESFEIKKYPKRTLIDLGLGDKRLYKPTISITSNDDGTFNSIITNFGNSSNKCEFNMDEDAEINDILLDNIKNIKIIVDDSIIYEDSPAMYKPIPKNKHLKIFDGSNVKIKIKRENSLLPSVVKLEN